jgi:hypothetical protein
MPSGCSVLDAEHGKGGDRLGEAAVNQMWQARGPSRALEFGRSLRIGLPVSHPGRRACTIVVL